MSESLKRICTAVIFIPIFLFFVFSNFYYGILFSITVLLITVLGTMELLDMLKEKGVRVHKSMSITFNSMIVIYTFLSTFNTLYVDIIYFIILLLFILLAIETFTNNDLSQSLNVVGNHLMLVLYLGVLPTYLILVKGLSQGNHLLLLLLCIVWFTDSGAYFGGKFFGKHKTSIKASPNKTLEGYISGIIFGTISGIILLLILPNDYKLTFLGMLCLCFVFSVLTIIGDLAESVIKRSTGVKDSKKWIPGHGGVLDVFDSLIYTAPCLYFVQTHIVSIC